MPSTNTPYWRFAPTNGGAEQSRNPGLVTFQDDAMAKATRELLQNSTDHPEPGLETVTVKFELTQIPRTLVGADSLLEHLTAAQKHLKP